MLKFKENCNKICCKSTEFMANFIERFLLVLLLVLPCVIQFAGPGSGSMLMVHAQDDSDSQADIVDGEEDMDATVEAEDAASDADAANVDVTATDTEADKEEDEEAEKPLKPSPDAETNILFIRPTSLDFPAGYPVKFLVGFTNNGEKDFVVETMDAAFRYPQDYSFYIQNFTVYRYYRTVEPKREATFEYSFTPSETFSARPFGLTVNLNYKDIEGNPFQDAVFNATINISELDEGLDGETFFLYVFLAAVAILAVVGLQQLFSTFGKKHMSSKPKTHVEMGTQNNKTDVDYDWIPKETLQDLNKSPKRSPKTKFSPRQRTAKRRSGGIDD